MIFLGFAKAGSGKLWPEIFKSDKTPTARSHGKKYAGAMGPFRTMRGARFMQKCGLGNPHIKNVADAERIAKAQGA